MDTAHPILRVAASTLLATLAFSPVAHADEPESAPGLSEPTAEEVSSGEQAPEGPVPAEQISPETTSTASWLPAASTEASAAPQAGVGPTSSAPLAPARVAWTPREPAPLDRPGARNPTLGAWGIATAALGLGGLVTGAALAVERDDAALPVLAVGATASLTGVVMIGLGYSSDTPDERDAAAAKRQQRAVPTPDEPTWREKQASRKTRRDVGIGLTMGGVALGGGGASFIAVGVDKARRSGGSMSLNFDGLGEQYLGGAMVGVGTLLLAFGVPLWAVNSGEEPRPPVRAELGLGPGSFELRGSF